MVIDQGEENNGFGIDILSQDSVRGMGTTWAEFSHVHLYEEEKSKGKERRRSFNVKLTHKNSLARSKGPKS